MSKDVQTKEPAKTGVAALDELFKPFNRSDAPGLVVGVAHNGKTVYRKGFGLASIEHALANTPWTRMNIGSSAKHFTALAALLLAEEGKLDIDAPVRNYLPQIPAVDPEPTLRQLMNHTSGYRSYLELNFLANGMAVRPRGSALAAQLRQTDVNFPAGQRRLYCNGGYHLLSIIVEQVSGIAFGQFLKERLFDPLGMLDTESAPNDFEIRRGMATLHLLQADGSYRRGIFPSEETRGDGGVISTIDDMLRWLAHMRGPKRVGSENSWAQMLAHTHLKSGCVIPYGLGLSRTPYRGAETVHHAGGVFGGACQMLTVPSQALDIVVMTNGSMADPSALAKKIIDAMLGDEVLAPSVDADGPRSENFKALAGRRYRSPSGFVVSFADVEGKLRFSIPGTAPVIPMRLDGEDLLVAFEDIGLGPFGVCLNGVSAKSKAPEFLEISEGGDFERFALLPETPPGTCVVDPSLTGSYHSPDADARAQISLIDGTLQLRVTDGYGSASMALTAYGGDVFGWPMEPPMPPLPWVLNVERFDGRVTGFRMNTARVRKVLFSRACA